MNIIQIYKRFPTQASCIEHLEEIRWNGTPTCPYCKSTNIIKRTKTLRHHCVGCNRKFTVLVGTIFHSTKLELQKWFFAISTVLNAKKGISSLQIHRELGISQKTAWYLIMRIRKTFKEKPEYMTGIVEMDEFYHGGVMKNKHRSERNVHAKGKQTGNQHLTPVFGMLQRNGNVRCFVMDEQPSQDSLRPIIFENIHASATIITDGFSGYKDLDLIYKAHQKVYHTSDHFVDGEFHTNTIESFWATLKRGIMGSFHQVSKAYLKEYLNEFCFRYNHRGHDNMFELVLQRAM